MNKKYPHLVFLLESQRGGVLDVIKDIIQMNATALFPPVGICMFVMLKYV